MEMMMMDDGVRERSRRERVMTKMDKYRGLVKTWEAAVAKAEGRKPQKHDLATAPDSVKLAYKEYYKIKKYLDSHEPVSPSPRRKSKENGQGLTPSKIFVKKGWRSRGGVEAEAAENRVSSSSSQKRQGRQDPPPASPPPGKKIPRGILKQGKGKDQGGNVPGLNFSIFKERVNFVTKLALCTNNGKANQELSDIVEKTLEEESSSSMHSGSVDSAGEPVTSISAELGVEFNSGWLPSLNCSKVRDTCSHPMNTQQEDTSSSSEWQISISLADFGEDTQINIDLSNSLNPEEWHSNHPQPMSIGSEWQPHLASVGVDDSSNSKLQSSDVENMDMTSSSEQWQQLQPVSVPLTNFNDQADRVPSTTNTSRFDENEWRPRLTLVTADAVSNSKCVTPDDQPSSPLVKSSGTKEDSAIEKVSISTSRISKKSKAPTQSVSPASKRRRSRKGDIEYFDDSANPKPSKKRRKLETGGFAAGPSSKPQKDENFRKINIEKKVFVRGYKKTSAVKAKRDAWKAKKSAKSKEEKMLALTCKKCGETGHFWKFCPKDAANEQQSQQTTEVDNSPFPSLQEVAAMAKTKMLAQSKPINLLDPKQAPRTTTTNVANPMCNDDTANSDDSGCLDGDEDNCVGEDQSQMGNSAVEAYFESPESEITENENNLLKDTITKFGYKDFRPGQKEAVSRILKGLSTLCILSTGSGKSLCYQLPAYLYAQKYPGALAICVSPLVSLMEDQVMGIPGFLQAAFLHSAMPAGQKEKVVEKVRSRKLHILLVSPEAVCGGLFGLLRGDDLPQISFACIDEVHCTSQWSHNFRPCYLQLSKILREKLKVKTLLGLTATATEHTALSICETLLIDPSTTIRGEILPINLKLSASRDTFRDEALMALLKGERLRDCESIIVYCTRRDECQRIAALIRTSLQDVSNRVTNINKRQRVSNTCEAYHAGMTAGKRRLVQQQFMSGKIRIVVATVAFGMGIDKADIRSVIHYNMPKTFESYVQEVGRAGRDGLPAHCHLFLDNIKGRDLSELKRHVYSNSIDRGILRKLLRKVFQSCKCFRVAEHSSVDSIPKNVNKRCPGHEVSFSIEETVQDLDLPQENITTLLCYLELDKRRKWIEMLPHTYQTCKIDSYGGAALLKAAALKSPPLAAAIALKKEKKKFKDTDTYLVFDVIELCAAFGWNSGIVKRELKNLEWSGTDFNPQGNATRFRKSGILVEFSDLAFHIHAPGDLTDEEADEVLNYLYNHNVDQEKTQLYQLHRVYQALSSIATPSVETVCDKFDEEKSSSLKNFIESYFRQSSIEIPAEWKTEVSYSESQDEEIKHSIRDLLTSVKDASFTGRAVAKIFQGIPSPCFPVEHWGRNRAFWRKYMDVDFHYLCKIACQEILRF